MAILNDVLDHSKIEAGKLTSTQRRCRCMPMAASVVALFRGQRREQGPGAGARSRSDIVDWVLGDAPAPEAGAAQPGRQCHQVHRDAAGSRCVVRSRRRRGAARRARSRSATPASACRPRRCSDCSSRSTRPTARAAAARRHRPRPGDQPAHRRGDGRPHRGREPARRGLALPLHARARSRRAPRRRRRPTRRWAASRRRDVGGTVLVVEDNAVNRMIAARVLQSLGIDVVEASDGREALDAVAQHASTWSSWTARCR